MIRPPKVEDLIIELRVRIRPLREVPDHVAAFVIVVQHVGDIIFRVSKGFLHILVVGD